MRDPLRLIMIGLAVVAVAVMGVGYVFIFRGVASGPVGTLGTLDTPPAGTVVAETLADGTPVFVVNIEDTTAVLDARSPVAPGSVPVLVAWCSEASAFETGFLGQGDMVSTLGFDPDGTAFGLRASPGLARYAVREDGDGRIVVLDSTSRTEGRIGAPPDCPIGSEHVMHEPAEDEIFDPSVAAEEEPPGMVWLEGTLMSIGGQAMLCDGILSDPGNCDSGAVATGIDPSTIEPAGIGAGLFFGIVRDGAISGLAHALVLSEAEGS
jgi:hypothetical protein